MKDIIFKFHKEELYNELLTEINKSAEKYKGQNKFEINETDENIIVNIIDKV